MTITLVSLSRNDAGTPAVAATTETVSMPEASTSYVNIDPLYGAALVTVSVTRTDEGSATIAANTKTVTYANIRSSDCLPDYADEAADAVTVS